MTRDPLLPLLGYDARLASELSPVAQGQLRSVVVGWLAVLVLLAWPLGYVFWLTEHSIVLAIIGAVSVYGLCLNLLRVAVAGGGAGVSFSPERVRGWRPGLVPPAFLLVMACLMAQPAHLLFSHDDHSAAVAARRVELLAKHVASVMNVDHPSSPAPNDTTHAAPNSAGSFTASLSECEFVVYRVQLLWRNPSSAVRFTALYALLVLIPVFWVRFVALEALRAYEWRRYREVLTHVLAGRTGTSGAVREVLSNWASYAAAQSFNDDAQHDLELTGRALSEPRRVPRSQPILRWRTGL